MCRLFGLNAGRQRVHATFWLVEAGDSLSRQSHENPDGTGLGWFDEDGRPHVEKQALAAFDDADFATEAKDRCSETFVAHVRKSSGSAVADRNTHPFTLDGRIFAHNGVIGDIDRLEAHLGDDLSRVQGDTDSERLFALLTREIAAAGDVGTGIEAAMAWVAGNLSVMSANFVLTEPGRLWAVRYPETHELWFLDRRSSDSGMGGMDHRSSTGTRVASDHLADAPSVVVASERLDDESAWQLLEPGELLTVDPDLDLTRSRILPTS